MTGRLNKSCVFTIKSRYDSLTDTYDDSNNWNFVNACAVCTNRSTCKYNTIAVMSNGTSLNFNYSNSVVITKIFYDVNDSRSINRVNNFMQSR